MVFSLYSFSVRSGDRRRQERRLRQEKASPREGVAKKKASPREGVAKKKASPREGVAKKGSVAKVEGVAQAQAPPRNMTEEKRAVYEVCAKVKRRYRNQARYSRVKFTSSV